SVSTCISLSLTHLYSFFSLFFFNDPATTEIYTLSLHDALPISDEHGALVILRQRRDDFAIRRDRFIILPDRRRLLCRRDHIILRSEEHTSELQSLAYLVCRLLLEKKKKNNQRRSQKTTSIYTYT